MNPNYKPPTANPVAYASSAPYVAEVVGTAADNSAMGHMSLPNSFNDGGAREFLSTQHWPAGLQDTFVKNLSRIAYRFFICDDSGSMASSDGHKLVTDSRKQKTYVKSSSSFFFGLVSIDFSFFRLVSCSRWSELTEALKFHAALARAASVPAEFRLLNGSAPILIGTEEDADGSRYNSLLGVLDASPGGGTPLCYHIRQVREVLLRLFTKY